MTQLNCRPISVRRVMLGYSKR